ncbi:MAG: hypothetical protein ABR555_18505, partial [Pyrinomonadaceae bacterium]
RQGVFDVEPLVQVIRPGLDRGGAHRHLNCDAWSLIISSHFVRRLIRWNEPEVKQVTDLEAQATQKRIIAGNCLIENSR